MSLTLNTIEQYVVPLATRMPFHFGNVVMDESAHLFVRLSATIDGTVVEGVAQAGIVPMWFLKEPDRSLVSAVEALLEVFEAAWTRAQEIEAATAFEFWRALYDRQRAWAADTDHPPLLWTYGVSVIEQAVIDATCRAHDTTFAAAIRDGTLGFDPGAIHDDLAGADPAALLPDEPRREVALRHTVGLGDPLTPTDVADAERLDDGLPQALSSYIEHDGVDHFKIKLSSDFERDRERLRGIRSVIEERLDEYAFTLDANEQYASAAAFRDQWERLRDDPALADFFESLLYVEQPLARDRAFTDATREVLTGWDGPPVIIDESDDRLDSLATALDHGYAGTSHKNCKGVFAGIADRCLAEHRRRSGAGDPVISGEDLTTIGPIELLADLAVMGTIGVEHVERNGHHYHRGLSMFPERVQESVLDAHGDLYRRHEDGFATLNVRDGRVALDSVLDAPFGHASTPDFDHDAFVPIEEWDPASVRAR